MPKRLSFYISTWIITSCKIICCLALGLAPITKFWVSYPLLWGYLHCISSKKCRIVENSTVTKLQVSCVKTIIIEPWIKSLICTYKNIKWVGEICHSTTRKSLFPTLHGYISAKRNSHGWTSSQIHPGTWSVRLWMSTYDI